MVIPQPKPDLSPEAYLEWERQQPDKHEYWNGEVYAMSGGSPNHARLIIATQSSLYRQLQGKSCEVFPTDLKVRVPKGNYAYPDVTVVCGEAQFEDKRQDILTNPTVVVEVLSPSTEWVDRGGKLYLYRQIPTLQEYLLVHQNQPLVEQYRRVGAKWEIIETAGLDEVVELASIGCRVVLSDVYARVKFEAGE